MKIRKKITIWISGAALFSTLAFSSLIFFELTEEPFKLIDKELVHMATVLAQRIKENTDHQKALNLNDMPYDPDEYWIVAENDQKKELYRSKLTEFTDLSTPSGKDKFLIEKHIPRTRIWLKQDRNDDVMFRGMVVQKEINGGFVEIRIAKPIEDLEEELIRLGITIGISLFLCALGIFILSYILAGRILRPISAIIHQSREISEKSLDQRIPLGKTKDELYELSVALNKMFDRIQHSFLRQKEFIGNASHELKSPITLLMLAQEDMLINEHLSSSAEESLIKQLETSRRMSHLVKNLLDLSRMEQQDQLHTKKINLSELIKRVLDDYGDMLAEKQIHVHKQIDTPCSMMGDPEKLFRLFVNLIDNAIRYNLPKKGVIEISLTQSRTMARVEILNTGLKIPEQDLPRLFEQFYRVEKSRSQALGGSGLGLAIARKIVSLHSGTIAIQNAPNRMIQIMVELPV
ncbi:sensor histidine kinase [Desulfobacter curvatus]|uniref:sensor histidine kinase n=1 Tax=Desulfobacter curvatus TaxID=2290 RepID=UPI00038044ED|nr:HAMP domain-containing sensor histidine kinase [Desulfobacter curvatus]